MGPTKNRGIGNTARGFVNAPPTNPGNGSGGAGTLPGTSVNFSPAFAEIGDVTTGRVTLGMVNFTILLMLGFYYWTRTAQGGG
jgi:hypothetical protein